MAALTRGLTYITHPSRAPLYSDAIAKMSIHVNMGSSSPSKSEAVTKLDYFEKVCRKVEDELYEAAGILSTRIDFIIEGISQLHTMLENKKYSTKQIEDAHQKFLPILEGHLDAISAGLRPARQATAEARPAAILAYQAVTQVVGDINNQLDGINKWKWFPAISHPQKVFISLFI